MRTVGLIMLAIVCLLLPAFLWTLAFGPLPNWLGGTP